VCYPSPSLCQLGGRYSLSFVHDPIDVREGSISLTGGVAVYGFLPADIEIRLNTIDLASVKAGPDPQINPQIKNYCVAFRWGDSPASGQVNECCASCPAFGYEAVPPRQAVAGSSIELMFDDNRAGGQFLHALILARNLNLLYQKAKSPYQGTCKCLVDLSERVVDLRLVCQAADISKLYTDSTTLDKFATLYFERLDFEELGSRVLDIIQKVCMMQVLFGGYRDTQWFEGWYISACLLTFGWAVWRFVQLTTRDYIVSVSVDLYPVPVVLGFLSVADEHAVDEHAVDGHAVDGHAAPAPTTYIFGLS